MTDEHKLIKERDRAEYARQVLNNPVYVEAMQQIESRLIETWRNTNAADEKGRENLWQALRILKHLNAALESTFKTGEMAAQQLESIQNGTDAAKRRGAPWRRPIGRV